MLIGVYTNVQPTTSPGEMLLKLYNYHMVSTASQYATDNQQRILYDTIQDNGLLLQCFQSLCTLAACVCFGGFRYRGKARGSCAWQAGKV